MRRFIIYCLLLYIISIPSYSGIERNLPKELRVAVILKNPDTQPHSSAQYVSYYKQGLAVASYYAESMGFKILYNFYVMKEPSNFLKQANQIKQSNPDFIIGPNYSNDFLLLKDYFQDILVLSANANDQRIDNLPKNFYTLTPLSDQYGQAVVNYIAKSFSKSNVFVLVDVNCKACIDMAIAVEKSFKKSCLHKKIYVEQIMVDELEEELLIPNSLATYKEGDVIIMLMPSFSSMTMINKLINHFKTPMTFIGADTWGSAKDSQLGGLSSVAPYKAIHIFPWSLNINTQQTALFKKLYHKNFPENTPDNITYATFSTVYSVINSLIKCSRNENSSLKNQVLQCYLKAIDKDKNKFRTKIFAVEKFENSKYGSIFLGTTSSDEKHCHDM